MWMSLTRSPGPRAKNHATLDGVVVPVALPEGGGGPNVRVEVIRPPRRQEGSPPPPPHPGLVEAGLEEAGAQRVPRDDGDWRRSGSRGLP